MAAYGEADRADPRPARRLVRAHRRPHPCTSGSPEEGAPMTAIIETEKLTKSYGTHRGIIEVDLAVEQGEVFGFLGPNGAGKTTTIRTLLDLIRPTSGRALVFGIESTADPVAIHRRIGYIPGEFTLYDRLTGAQTLEYFANLRGGVDRAYQASLIERFDLDPSRRFREYTKGNKQKVGAGHRAPAPARAARPRRADLRASTRSSSRRSSRSCARPSPTARRSSSRATSCPRSRRAATGSRSSARAGSSRSAPSTRCATSPTTRSSCASPARSRPPSSRRCPGVSDVVADDHVLRMRVSGRDHAGRPGRRPLRAARLRLAASRASRRRSSPSTAARPSR